MSKDVNNISNRTSVSKAISNLDLQYRQNKISFAIAVKQLNTRAHSLRR